MNIFRNGYSLLEWKNKYRKKTLNLFLEHEYGVRPLECDLPLQYSIVEEKRENNILIEKIEMKYKKHPMYFYIYLPSNHNNDLKTFITIVHPFQDKGDELISNYKSISSFCPIDEIIGKGFAAVLLSAGTVAEDRLGGEQTGIFKDMGLPKSDNSWGVLSSWAWACSKILDYLLTRSEFDEQKVAVIGHSRGGKTALLAAATDERFCLAISNCSGNSGAALSRGNKGEKIKDIVTRFPYWFCKNYQAFIDNEDMLPFDQHQLIGLIAPRFCYVASASEDAWADPEGELLSCRLASEYYEMYDIDGLVVPKRIEKDCSYNEGHIGYHIKTGVHKLQLEDWKMFMEFFDKI